jgi:plasmid stabilization system protein ParE
VDFQIVWTEPALADLEAIVRHVAADNLAAAEKLRLELLDWWRFLSDSRALVQHISGTARDGRGRSSAIVTGFFTGYKRQVTGLRF